MRASLDRLTASTLHALLQEHGGFTIDRHGEAMVDGISIGRPLGGRLRFPLAHWSTSAVERWLARSREELDADAAIGGWIDASGVVHLDVVDVFPECHVREATSTAAARGERWIHRLSTGEDIEVRP